MLALPRYDRVPRSALMALKWNVWVSLPLPSNQDSIEQLGSSAIFRNSLRTDAGRSRLKRPSRVTLTPPLSFFFASVAISSLVTASQNGEAISNDCLAAAI